VVVVEAENKEYAISQSEVIIAYLSGKNKKIIITA